MVVCSLALLWAGVSSDVATDGTLSTLVNDAVEVDSAIPDPANNGKLVIVPGALRSSEVYEDEFLKPNPSLIVQRRVEMLQWVEVPGTDGGEPTYSLQWSEAQVDFFKFRVPQGHENPLFQVTQRLYRAQQVRFGGFDGSRLLPLIKKLEPLELKPDILKDPAQEIDENKLVVRRNPGSDLAALGDMRVWYEAFTPGEYTVLTVQQDERNLVGASPSATLFIREGALSSHDFLEGMEGDADASSRGVFYLGGALLFFGCISLLMPHAHRFDLRPHLNVQGTLAVLVVSAGGTFVVMAVLYLLSLSR